MTPGKASHALLVLLVLVSFAGCTSRSSSVIVPFMPNLVDARPAIIFIHGFYGSALRRKNLGKRLFLTGSELLLGKEALSLHQSKLGTPAGPELEVEGLLATVPVIPGLYEKEVYSPFIRQLREANPKSQILPLVYDWREDLMQPVQKLDELVKLLQERGVPQISIVAHSMGGMVAVYYLGYGSQPLESAKLNWEGAKKVQKAVFFGTPFAGSMIAFRSFEKGSGIIRSEKMLNADTMSSFPSLYQLLPALASVRDKSGAPSTLPLFEFDSWKMYGFGLLRKQGLPGAIFAARQAFTSEQVGRAKRWSDLIQLGRTAAWPSPKNLKVLNVVSSAHQTLDFAYFQPETGKLLFDPDEVKGAGLKMEALYSLGDGSVSRTSAEVPAALEAATRVVTTSYPHETLFLDPSVQSEYNEFLQLPEQAEPSKTEIL